MCFCVSLKRRYKTKNKSEPQEQKSFIDDWLSSGHVALTDHVQGKKHDAVKKISAFFTLARKLSDKCEKEDKSNHNKKLQTLDMCVTKSDTLKAEIIWTLKLVMNGFSVRANDELKHTFAAMFPDSQTDISTPCML